MKITFNPVIIMPQTGHGDVSYVLPYIGGGSYFIQQIVPLGFNREFNIQFGSPSGQSCLLSALATSC